MQAHRTETVVTQDGVITLQNLPFRSGEAVEVIVLGEGRETVPAASASLRGTPVEFLQDPTLPVAVDDWEALR